MPERILSKIFILKLAIMGSIIAIYCFKFFDGRTGISVLPLFPLFIFIPSFLRDILYSMPSKKISTESSGALVYERTITREIKNNKSDIISGWLLFLLFLLIWTVLIRNILTKDSINRRFIEVYILIAAYFIALSSSNLYGLCCYERKITVALYERLLNISYHTEIYYPSRNATFPIDEISEVRIVSGEEEEELRQYLPRKWYNLPSHRTNRESLMGPYRFAFFLSKYFPLQDGHRAVKLELRKDNPVLVETDDAENFLDALNKLKQLAIGQAP